MIDFKPITKDKKEEFEQCLFDGNERGCEYSFANLYMWGRQRGEIIDGYLVLFSQYNRRTVYPFPVGNGDIKPVLDAVIADSKERGIPCRFTGMTAREKAILEELYPDKFSYHCDRDFFDYVYDINDLAELKGRKYHSKKNHFNRFVTAYPDYRVEPISDKNIDEVREMVDKWYADRLAEAPDSDFQMEQVAIEKAIKSYKELGMEGLALYIGDKMVAMTLASRMSYNTFDVHFEKAVRGIDGAYAVINCEFARYIRDKYPEIEFLNREDDMGIEGLRKAKEGYRPHHMVEKCWAHLSEDGYDY